MLGNQIGNKIIELNEVDSTNSFASRLLFDQMPEEGVVISAGFQTAGRGQRNASWQSEAGKNLLVSYILYPNFLSASNQFLLNQAISLGVFDFVQSIIPSGTKIKWPNDILIGKQKVAGMLIENTIRNNKFSSTIAGIGINVNQIGFDKFSPEATSLSLISNKSFDLKNALMQLNSFMNKLYSVLRSGNHQKINQAYLSALYGNGQKILFEKSGEEFISEIKGVNNHGQLILQNTSGEEAVFNNKEVRFIF